MSLSSRHKIRNSSPGGLRPNTLPLGHGGSPQYWLSHVDGEETFFVSFKPQRPGTEPRTLAWKAAVLTNTLGPPPRGRPKCWHRMAKLGGPVMPVSKMHYLLTLQAFCLCKATQQTRGIHPMLFQCRASVEDSGPTLKQLWLNSPCYQGKHIDLCWASGIHER